MLLKTLLLRRTAGTAVRITTVTLSLFCLWSCATVETNLADGNVFGACQVANEGRWPLYERNEKGERRIRETVQSASKVDFELLDFADPQFLGAPVDDRNLALLKLRIVLPPGVRSDFFDTFESQEPLEQRLRRALPPLEKPHFEPLPPGPLVIVPPPHHPPYKPPK